MEIRLAVGGRLREERKRIGLTQEQAATLGGVKKQAQVKYEGGSTTPSADYLAALYAHGFDISYVITGYHGVANDQESLLLRWFREADEDARQIAVDALNPMAKFIQKRSQASAERHDRIMATPGVAPLAKGADIGQYVEGNAKAKTQNFTFGGGKKKD